MNTKRNSPAQAAGQLDPAFGNQGIVRLQFSNGVRLKSAGGVAQASDGKIYVAGSTDQDAYALARLNSDGSPDLGFAEAGVATGKVQDLVSTGSDVLLMADGRLALVGTVKYPGLPISTPMVACYHADGTLDTSFGTDGATAFTGGVLDRADNEPSPTTASIPLDAFKPGASLQADGKILVTGLHPTTGIIYRANSDGTHDSSFNGQGWIALMLLPNQSHCAASVDQRGKVVAAGAFSNGWDGTDLNPILVRCSTTTGFDPAFGNGGMVTITSVQAQFTSLLITATGKLIGVGATERTSETQRAILTGLTEDGAADTTFNGGETVFTVAGEQGCAWTSGFLAEPAQGIVVAGSTWGPSGAALIGRFNADGTPDTSFGASGLAYVNAGDRTESSGVTVQADRKVLVAGQSTGPDPVSGFVARLLG